MRRTLVHLVDDIDGSAASETVVFGVDGIDYEIDLNDHHSGRFRELMDSYISHARRVETVPTGPRGRSSTRAERRQSARIRSWARDEGYDIGDYGRIPVEVRDAWERRAAAPEGRPGPPDDDSS